MKKISELLRKEPAWFIAGGVVLLALLGVMLASLPDTPAGATERSQLLGVMAVVAVATFVLALYTAQVLHAERRKAEQERAASDELSMDFALNLSAFFETLSKVAGGDLNARATADTKQELLTAMAGVINTTVTALREKQEDLERVRAADAAQGERVRVQVEELLTGITRMEQGNYGEPCRDTGAGEHLARVCQGLNHLMETVQRLQAENRKQQEQTQESAMDMALNLSAYFETLTKVAGGDFTARTTCDSRDELLVKTAEVINRTITALAAVLRKIDHMSLTVGASSHEVLGAAEELAKNMREESRQLNEISAAITEMSASIREIDGNAAQVAEQSRQSLQAAETGGHTVDTVLTRFAGIRTSVENSSKQITELGKKGKEIGKIVDVITQISEQTSLLALNAAIEAARAGEQGRGFAVVADEVSKLADRAAKSAKEIAELIETIQEMTDSAVSGIHHSVVEIREGSDMLNETDTALRGIAAATRDTDRLIEEIAAAVHQQAKVSANVAGTVDAISRISLEGASASAQLIKEGHNMQEMVNDMKTTISALKTE